MPRINVACVDSWSTKEWGWREAKRLESTIDKENVGGTPGRKVPAAVDLVGGVDLGRVDQAKGIAAKEG